MNVLITGAAGGLGRAFAISCAKKGYDLFLTDVNENGLLAIKQGLLRQYNITIEVKKCDLTNETELIDLFGYFDSQAIQFDMLLNVAGIDFEGGFLGVEAHKVSDIIRLNIEATLRITHEILERRIQGSKFYIVFVSSLASVSPMPLKATYAASKRFLLDFSIALSKEMADQNVEVLALCPGGLPTTKEALQGIAAQGFWGFVTTNHLESMTDKTISKVLKGKSLYVPGSLNKVFHFFSNFMPKSIIAQIVYLRWKQAQNSIEI